MVLKGTDGFLRRVVTVEVGGDELPRDVVCLKKLFYEFWALVV